MKTKQDFINFLTNNFNNIEFSIKEYKLLNSNYFQIVIADTYYNKNNIPLIERTNIITLSYCLDDNELKPQIYGGMGGETITIESDEKHLFCKYIQIPFRSNRDTFKSLGNFIKNYQKLLRENATKLKYKNFELLAA